MFSKNFSKNLAMLLLFIIIILIIIIFMYYNTSKNISVLTDFIIEEQKNENENPQSDILALFNDFEKTVTIDENTLNNDLIETYIFYIYFDNLYGNELWLSNFSSPKKILRRENTLFNISYHPENNQLLISIPIKRIGITNKNNQEESLNLNNTSELIVVNGLKMQKWTQIAVSIDGREVNVYIDKKLRKNTILENVPILSNENIIIGEKYKNPNCYIGKIQYSNKEISLNDLKALYLQNLNSFKINNLLRQKIYYDNEKIKESIYDKNKNYSPS